MPIIIDCGGSTRVKRIKGDDKGDMQGLLDLDDLPAPPLPNGARGGTHKVNDPFASMNIVFQDSTGKAFTVPVPLPTNFLVTSSLGQSVRGDFDNNHHLTITVYSTSVDPLVRLEQHADAGKKLRRRYNVTNAGAIQTVAKDVSIGSPAGTVIFNASDTSSVSGATGVAVYVSIVVDI